jgi:two-component system sensor histidine kinase SenX3
VSPLVAAAAFLFGAALSAFGAAWYVRRGEGTAVPANTPEAKPAALSQRVLAALDLGVVVVDRDEYAVFANPVAQKLKVVDADRLALPELSELVRQVTDSGRPDSVLIDLAGHGPETFSVRAMPLLVNQRVQSVVLRFVDVTEARRVELVRRDFVANVSHELKTPVGALTLLAEAVQEAADDPAAVQHFAERMQREGSRLGRLVQELIELSRLQGAEPLPGDALVEVGRVLSEAVDRSRLLAEQANISVLCRPEGELWVRGNETQLTTAIGNLIDNAIAYSPPHTRVSVTSRAETDADGTGWVAISVTDQGIGIAEADLDRVFERFYRVDPARSRATGGTGLGLAIVKHIATNHGGSVAVWSVVGSGSTFTIRLPLAGRPSAPEPLDQPIESHV